jgi:hypothetical protein
VKCPKHCNKKKTKKTKKNNIGQDFWDDILNQQYKEEEYTLNMLNTIKTILVGQIKKINPELTNYIVDNYIDNRNICAICNVKQNSYILYPCYYCKKLVCDDNCNNCKDTGSEIIYYCLTCEANGIVCDDESENLNYYNYDDQTDNQTDNQTDDESDNISVISANSTITEYSIDLEEIIKKNKNCGCGKKAKYLIKNIGKISRCWKCSNLLSPKNNDPEFYRNYVCDLNCSSGVYIDSLKKTNDKYIIESFVDKDECYKCGVRNMNTYFSEVIKFINEPDFNPREKCDCENILKYKLKNKSEIKCIGCKYTLYEKNKLGLNLCSTKCEFDHGWKIQEYLTKKKKKVDLEFKFVNTDFKCEKCGLKQDLETIFIGDKIIYDEKLFFL